MRALLVRYGGILLPCYCGDSAGGALVLPQHPVMRNAHATGELLGPQGLSAYDGYSHRIAAGVQG